MIVRITGVRRLREVLMVSVVASLSVAEAQAPAASNQCRGCEIVRTRVATVGSESDSILLGAAASPLLLSDGRVVALPDDRSALLLYDKAGRFQRAGSRRGYGPGELSSPGSIAVGPGDTIFVYQRGRIDLFTPALRFVRSVNVPGVAVASMAVIGNGQLVFFSSGRDDPYLLHTMEMSAARLKSFGAERLPAGTCQGCRVRGFSSSLIRDEFLAVSPAQRVFERWTVSGLLKQTFSVDAPWLRETASNANPAQSRPLPEINSVSQSADGLIWVGGRHVNEKWTPPPQMRGSVAGKTVGGVPAGGMPSADNSGITSVIDVYDPSTGVRLASAHFPGELLGLRPNGMAYNRRQTADGFVLLDIWQFSLRRP